MACMLQAKSVSICPKCGKPQVFPSVRSGGRQFQSVYCDGHYDPLEVDSVRGWLRGELSREPQ
jgi:hypothetical protein